MKPPVEFCTRGHGEIKPIDNGAYYYYKCPRCEVEIKNYKPPKPPGPGELKKYAPER